MLDVTEQNRALSARVFERIQALVASGQFILGAEVERFEREAAAFLGSKHAIGCASGSDALVVALRALRIGPGDEVITTPFSFFASVESIVRVGARPRFVDLGSDSFELDMEALRAGINPRTRAILGVHLYGYPACADLWQEFARERGIALIEDAAQAFGARLRGRAAGTFGALGCFSFQPSKPLGAWGDAGLVVTDDPALAERCRSLRAHGSAEKHRHREMGGNYRLDALQAAVLSEKLQALPGWLSARRERAAFYDRRLCELPGLTTPRASAETEPSHALYTIRVNGQRRDALARFLSDHQVDTAIHYPLALHRQPALLALGIGGEQGDLPCAERAAEEVLSLPLYPELRFDQLEHVAACVREFFGY